MALKRWWECLLVVNEGGAAMVGKRRQTPRKPATKFAHLRKKMAKAGIVAKIGNRKK